MDYNSIIELFSNNPEGNLINKIKEFAKEKSSEKQYILSSIKKYVEKYILEY